MCNTVTHVCRPATPDEVECLGRSRRRPSRSPTASGAADPGARGRRTHPMPNWSRPGAAAAVGAVGRRPRRAGRDRRRRALRVDDRTGCCAPAASPRWTCCAARTPVSRMRPMRCCCPATTTRSPTILRYCSQHGIAVVPFGGGTSVVGGLDPHPRRVRRGGVAGPAAVRRAALASTRSSGEAELGAGVTGPRGRATARRTRLLARALPAELRVRHASAASPRPARRGRTRRATAGSTTWSAACAR